MKSLHKLNVFAVAANLLLFIVPWFGMLAMIPLGIIQLFIAGSIVINYYRDLDRKHKGMIEKYWLMVAIDFIGIAVLVCTASQFMEELVAIALFFLFPGFIALYFVYTTYLITKHFGSPAHH